MRATEDARDSDGQEEKERVGAIARAGEQARERRKREDRQHSDETINTEQRHHGSVGMPHKRRDRYPISLPYRYPPLFSCAPETRKTHG